MKPILCALALFVPGFAQSSNTPAPGVPIRILVTAETKAGTHTQISASDVMVYQNGKRVPVTEFSSLGPDRSGLQFWVLIDDGDETVLATQIGDIKKFIAAQPAGEQIGIGYLQNGSVRVAHDLTTDHQAAQNAIRMPLGVPGISASPYIALASFIKKWQPSDHSREILMVTSGIDPDFGAGPGNPYLDQATDAALRAHVIVHAIWYRSAGHVGHSYALVTWGQNYLSQITEDTGGEFFWQGFMNPVSFAPYLNQLDEELSEQYWLAFSAKPPAKPSFQKVRIGTEVPGTSIVGPSRVWADPSASRRQTG